MRSILLPVVLALLLSSCSMFVERDEVAFFDLEHAPRLRVSENVVAVINSESEWADFLNRHIPYPVMIPASGVDFNRHSVVGIYFGGQVFGGCFSYVDVVRSAQASGSTVVLDVAPVPDLGACRAIQHPYQVIAIEGKFNAARIRPVPR
jgi:hypothetical protein